MLSIHDELSKIKKTQRTIDSMIEAGILARDEMHFENLESQLDIDILFQKDATIGIGTVGQKSMMPEHVHKDSKHYLICVSGRFIIKFEGILRVLTPGDCVSIPPGVPHTTQCTQAGQIIFINVPADKAWTNGRIQ